LAALTSFTLIGPLGLPWWFPLILVGVVGTAGVGLRQPVRTSTHGSRGRPAQTAVASPDEGAQSG
jgi:hypothetical protein